MGTSNYSNEFKRDAVHKITVRGYPVGEVSKKDNGVLRARVPMKYAFIRAHREELGIRAMCRMLRVHFSVF